MKKAIVLLSGGLDSTTCLAIAKHEGYECYALSFDYHQRHVSELLASKDIANSFGVIEHRIVALDLGQFGGSALTDSKIKVPELSNSKEIPVTYVPARNTVFLSIALAFAEVVGAYDIFIGVNAIDYSGYPDCRPEFIHAFQTMANLGTKVGVDGKKINIKTPLLYLSKAEIILTGHNLGVDFGLTRSCYQLNDHGFACGVCDSCLLRKQGFIAANIPDPTHYY